MERAAATRLDRELLERCWRIATATWSDALDSAGIDGVMKGLTMRSGSGRIAGEAVTILEEVQPFGSAPLSDFDVGAILRATTAGAIAVVSMGGAEVSTFGGLSARAAVEGGVAGIVIDGGCRDIERIRAVGLHLTSRHVTPTSGKRRVRVVGINQAVSCGGIRVASGDLVVADETGVVVVPADRIVEVLAVAERLEGNDRIFERQLSAGAEFGTVAARLGHL